MRSVLAVVNEENLMNRLKAVLKDNSIEYFFTSTIEEAMNIVESREISIAIIEYRMPVMTGEELAEDLILKNDRIEVMFVFDEEDTADVLNTYNHLHISKLLCKENLMLELLPQYIDDALFSYNREEELKRMDDVYRRVHDTYLKPVKEISDLLNDRVQGYQMIVRSFLCSIRCLFKDDVHAGIPGLKEDDGTDDGNVRGAVITYIDRLLNDYIQVYMVNEPSYDAFIKTLMDRFNAPGEKKFFRVDNNVQTELEGEVMLNVLYTINAVLICFDSFFRYYRGKMEISEKDNYYCLNILYEVRGDDALKDVGNTALHLNEELMHTFAYRSKYGRDGDFVQYRAYFIKQQPKDMSRVKKA